jgi:putative acetyltransferase
VGKKQVTTAETKILVSVESPLSDAASQLIRELSADIVQRYAELGQDGSGSFTPSDVLVPRSAFLVARLEGRPVGCAALRLLDAEVAEVKRMYVALPARRKGVGRVLLAELERMASGFGYRILRLETGNRQPEAVALYESCGYCKIPAFGKYIGNPVSICYEKAVTPNHVA